MRNAGVIYFEDISENNGYIDPAAGLNAAEQFRAGYNILCQ
jgi:hypothetical protein